MDPAHDPIGIHPARDLQRSVVSDSCVKARLVDYNRAFKSLKYGALNLWLSNEQSHASAADLHGSLIP